VTKELSELMADAARDLQAQAAPQETYDTAVQLALRDVGGCDAACLSMVRRRREVETPASTSAAATRGDELQYETGEGPCLDAIWEQDLVHSTDLGSDPSWPIWGPRVADEVGFHSMLAFRLFTHDDRLGALNLYSSRRDGFRAEDVDHGLALAAHIAVAVRSAQRIQSLDQALSSRTTIAMALGILMERHRLDQERAFAVLNRVASTEERKVREVAAELVETRRLPATTNGVQPTG
jgi:transcriptional regulator with GAF, ATPase, and Fis domain